MLLDGRVDGSFKLGEWLVDPALNQIGANGSTTRVEPKAMQVLLYLANHPGVVSKEQLISGVWPDVFVSEDVLPGCISALRKAFGDSARNPAVIETIPKNGYRLLLPVKPLNAGIVRAEPESMDSGQAAKRRRLAVAATAIGLCVVLLTALAWFPSRHRYTSVAVLPFVNASRDAGAAYLSDGIAEQVVDDLSQSNSVRVMSWTSVSRYRQPQSDVRAIGRELGVQSVLAGTFTRESDRIVLQTELVDVNNGSQIWGERYDQKVTDLTSLQQNLSHDISDKLRLKLTGGEQQNIQRRYESSAPAYELYLKGRFFWGKRSKAGPEQGIHYFQQAIAIDPKFALAYAGLADCYNLLDDWGESAPRDSFPQARAAAEKAIALDDSLAEAHVSLAMVRASYDWDWMGSEEEFKRAIQLNPNYATAHQWYGMTLASLGRFSEGEAEVKRARELDPLSAIVNMAIGEVYAWEGKDDDAIAQFKRVVELEPTFAGVYGNLAASYEQKHMYAEAFAAKKQEEILSGNAVLAADLQNAYMKSGYEGMVREHLKQTLEKRKRTYVSATGIASMYAYLGDAPHALQWLEKGYEEHASGMQYLAVSRDFASLQTNPQFLYWMNVLALPTQRSPSGPNQSVTEFRGLTPN